MKQEELNETEITKFYKQVMLRFEINIKDPFNSDDMRKRNPVPLLSPGQSQQIEKEWAIKLYTETIDKINEIKDINNLENNTIKQYIVDNDESIRYYSLYNHLRNSFAHGYIQKIDDFYLFQDRNCKGEKTMVAKIKQTDFFEFIDKIYTENQIYNNKPIQ